MKLPAKEKKITHLQPSELQSDDWYIYRPVSE